MHNWQGLLDEAFQRCPSVERFFRSDTLRFFLGRLKEGYGCQGMPCRAGWKIVVGDPVKSIDGKWGRAISDRCTKAILFFFFCFVNGSVEYTTHELMILSLSVPSFTNKRLGARSKLKENEREKKNVSR